MPSRDNDYKKRVFIPDKSETSFHDASITENMFNYILGVLPDGSTILELGSGWATGELAKHYTMFSVEHDEDYLDKYDSTYLEVPLKQHKKLKNHESIIWYDSDILAEKLKGIKYDLLLVDGPPQTRSGFYKYKELFDSDAIWIFDDIHRSVDRRVLNSVATAARRPYVVYCSVDGKPFGVINDPVMKGHK